MIGRRRKLGLASRATTSRKQTHLCLVFKQLFDYRLHHYTTRFKKLFQLIFFVQMNGFICNLIYFSFFNLIRYNRRLFILYLVVVLFNSILYTCFGFINLICSNVLLIHLPFMFYISGKFGEFPLISSVFMVRHVQF